MLRILIVVVVAVACGADHKSQEEKGIGASTHQTSDSEESIRELAACQNQANLVGGVLDARYPEAPGGDAPVAPPANFQQPPAPPPAPQPEPPVAPEPEKKPAGTNPGYQPYYGGGTYTGSGCQRTTTCCTCCKRRY